MEFGIEPHSLFQARGTTGNDHISATLPNASHRRAVFSVQCPARHSGVAPLWLFGLAQELGDSAAGCQVRRSGLIEALGTSVMGQGRRPTLKSAAHDAACVPAACYRRCLQGQRGQPRAKRKVSKLSSLIVIVGVPGLL